MNYKEALELPSDFGCYPKFFSWISLPFKTTSKGFNSSKNRYIHKSNEVTLELSTNDNTAKLPVGKVGRSVIAYLASKIVRPQFALLRKELGYSSSPDDIIFTKRRFQSYKFYLPKLSEMTQEIMGDNGGKSMKIVYEQLRGFLLCSMYIAPSKQVQKVFPYIPERLFILANEVKINKGIKKSKTENYVILTREGLNFLLDTIPVVFGDFIKLASPLEQDLYAYLTRKSFIYNQFDSKYSIKDEPSQVKELPNINFPSKPKKIKLSDLVLQFFNIARNDKNYKRAEEKLREAHYNLCKIYKNVGDLAPVYGDTLFICGCNDLFELSKVTKKVKEKQEKAQFLRTIEKWRNQEPFIQKYYQSHPEKFKMRYGISTRVFSGRISA